MLRRRRANIRVDVKAFFSFVSVTLAVAGAAAVIAGLSPSP
jgi:hypothetical protein